MPKEFDEESSELQEPGEAVREPNTGFIREPNTGIAREPNTREPNTRTKEDAADDE